MSLFKHVDPSGQEVVIFAQIGHTASACALRTVRQSVVEEVVNKKLRPTIGMYRVVDIASVRPGPSSPDPCGAYPDRQHWFLISRRLGVWRDHLRNRQ